MRSIQLLWWWRPSQQSSSPWRAHLLRRFARLLLITTIFIIASTPAHLTGVDIDLVGSEADGSALKNEKNDENATCGSFWTPYIGWTDTSFDATSSNSVSPGCNLITTCLTGNNGGLTGLASFQIYEVPVSGSQVLKSSGFISSPWSGCSVKVNAFTIANNSKVRLVVSNDGFELVFQMNAG